MEIRNIQCEVRDGGSGPSLGGGPATGRFFFPAFGDPLERATVGLSALFSAFEDEHSFGEHHIELTPFFRQNQVQVALKLGLRDQTGNWDDRYHGKLQAVALAEPMANNSAVTFSGALEINRIDIRQRRIRSEFLAYQDWKRYDPFIPLKAGRVTDIRAVVLYRPTDKYPDLTQVAGLMLFDAQRYLREQRKQHRTTPISRREALLDFQFTQTESQGLVAVRFQARTPANSAVQVNSYIVGTVLRFLP